MERKIKQKQLISVSIDEILDRILALAEEKALKQTPDDIKKAKKLFFERYHFVPGNFTTFYKEATKPIWKNVVLVYPQRKLVWNISAAPHEKIEDVLYSQIWNQPVERRVSPFPAELRVGNTLVSSTMHWREIPHELYVKLLTPEEQKRMLG